VQDPQLGIKLAQAYKRTGNLAKAKPIDSVIKKYPTNQEYIKKHCRNDFKKTYITLSFYACLLDVS
jgi:hypothetical protein